MAAWAVLALVIPALISAFSTALYPPPSRQALTVEMRQWEIVARSSAPAEFKRLMHDHPDMRQGDASIEDWRKAAVLQRRTVESELAPARAAFELQLSEQRYIADFADLASPALGISDVLTDIAGTGQNRHRQFREQALQYKSEVQEQLAPFMLSGQLMSEEEVKAVPEFAFHERLAQRPLWITAFWAFIAGTFLFVAFRRARNIAIV